MTVRLLLAAAGAPWESALVAGLDRQDGVRVVRRCLDLADLVAVAVTGAADVAVVSARLRRLDREVVARLAGVGVGVVAVVDPNDPQAPDAAERLTGCGVHAVAGPDVDGVLLAATAAAGAPGAVGVADARAVRPTAPEGCPWPAPSEDAVADRRGRLVAVWGPTGAPGRSTVALTLADELARSGRSVLLADADTYGASQAQLLGVLDEAPGLAAAARLASSGRLDATALGRVAVAVEPCLRLLSGPVRPDRWPELRAASLEAVWALARQVADVVVVDCGFCLEHDEVATFDGVAGRNDATRVTLSCADTVVAVGAADPVGMQRLLRALPEALATAAPTATVRVVVNRVPRPASAARVVRELLAVHAGRDDVVLVPDDRPAVGRAVELGQPLGRAAPGSPARRALLALAEELVVDTDAWPVPQRARRRLRRAG